MNDQPLIAVRIKDGIFVGNVTAAHDEEFLYMNKVTHILNCAGNEVRNLFTNDSCIKYLTFPFKDSTAMSNLSTSSGIMFDTHDRNIDKVTAFIDETLADGECVLVHCVNGLSRSCCIVAAYFIAKYGWKLENALSFLQMAHQEMEILPCWMKQLRQFSKRHFIANDVFDPEVDDSSFALDNDQWMLRNTLLNGLSSNIQEGNALFKDCVSKNPVQEVSHKIPLRRRRRITYVDTHQGTSVASNTTTPVVTRPVPKYVGNVGDFSGTEGVKALLAGPKERSTTYREMAGSVRNNIGPTGEPILARSVPPNTRGLESPSDIDAKGRLQLRLKRNTNDVNVGSFSRQNSKQGESTAVRSHVDLVGPAVVNVSAAAAKQPVPLAINSTTADQQQAVRQAVTPQSHLVGAFRGTNGQGNHQPSESVARTPSNISVTNSSVTAQRTNSVITEQSNNQEAQQRAPRSASIHTQNSQEVRTRTSSQERRRVAPTTGYQSSPQISAGRPPSTASQQRIIGVQGNLSNGPNTTSNMSSAAKSAIRSPFTVHSNSKGRIGSPLPQQRKTGTVPQPQTTAIQYSRINSGGAPPTLRTALCGPSFVDPRVSTNSPMYRSASQNRGSSPMAKTTTAVRPSSTIGLRSQVGATSPRYGQSQPTSTIVRGQPQSTTASNMIRRTNSPLPQTQQRVPTTIHSTTQNTIKRAPSPIQTGVTRSAYGLSHVTGGSRQSSPMQRSQVGIGAQPNSPLRKRVGTDQYIGGLSNGSQSPSGIGARTAVNRRSSPMEIRRY